MKARSLRCLSSPSQTRFAGLCLGKGLREKLGSLLRIMQASQEFFGLIVFTLHLSRCVPQLKHTFLDSSRPLCCLTLSLSRFFVQFSRYKSLTHFDVRYETLTLVKISYPASMLSLVGPSGLEPPTLRLSVVRSSQLSYGPSSSQSPLVSVSSAASRLCRKLRSLPCSSSSNQTRFAGL